MAGFFSTIKAIHHCSSELLTVGKEYALKFKKNEIDARQYEYEMVGKIYELTNKYAEGDEDLEKHLKQHFADSMTKFLKEGIQLYTESLDQANKNKDEDIPQEIPENKEKTRMSESIEQVNSSHNVVTSSNVIETIDNIKSILAEINPYTEKHGGYYEDRIPKGFKIPKEKQEGYKESQKAEISRIQDKFYDSSKLGNLQNNEYNIYGVETALKNMGFKIVNDEKSKTELSKKGITITLPKEKEFINKNKLQDVLKYMIEVFPQGALTKFDNEYNKLGLVAGKKDNLKKKTNEPINIDIKVSSKILENIKNNNSNFNIYIPEVLYNECKKIYQNYCLKNPDYVKNINRNVDYSNNPDIDVSLTSKTTKIDKVKKLVNDLKFNVKVVDGGDHTKHFNLWGCFIAVPKHKITKIDTIKNDFRNALCTMRNIFELSCMVLFESGINVVIDNNIKNNEIVGSPVIIKNKEDLLNKDFFNKPYQYILSYDLIKFKLSDVTNEL